MSHAVYRKFYIIDDEIHNIEDIAKAGNKQLPQRGSRVSFLTSRAL
jgi:hypothetical protein